MLGWQDAVTVTERYDACSKTWSKVASLPAPRGYVQAAELNGKLYVVGGVDRVLNHRCIRSCLRPAAMSSCTIRKPIRGALPRL